MEFFDFHDFINFQMKFKDCRNSQMESYDFNYLRDSQNSMIFIIFIDFNDSQHFRMETKDFHDFRDSLMKF